MVDPAHPPQSLQCKCIEQRWSILDELRGGAEVQQIGQPDHCHCVCRFCILLHIHTHLQPDHHHCLPFLQTCAYLCTYIRYDTHLHKHVCNLFSPFFCRLPSSVKWNTMLGFCNAISYNAMGTEAGPAVNIMQQSDEHNGWTLIICSAMGTEALGMGTSSGIIMQHTEKQWALAVGVT